MVNKKSWEEFRSSGLLLIINQTLHIFGWALVFEVNENEEVIQAYPARVKFRGFSNESTSEGYSKITTYMKNNIDELDEEVNLSMQKKYNKL